MAALEKMAGWTKQGGTVVAQEFDFGAITVEPTCPAMGELHRVRGRVPRPWAQFAGLGANSRARSQAAGLGDAVLPTLPAVYFLPLAEMAAMMIGVYDSLYAAGAEFGLADPVRASAFRAYMMEAGEDGRYYCLTPVLIAACKRIA